MLQNGMEWDCNMEPKLRLARESTGRSKWIPMSTRMGQNKILRYRDKNDKQATSITSERSFAFVTIRGIKGCRRKAEMDAEQTTAFGL